jgi:hypothetical protein
MDDKLIEKYVEDETKIATINGLLMAQAICSRKLQDVYSRDILDIMRVIALSIEDIKNK